jgi:CheY-like chemotaxis protein
MEAVGRLAGGVAHDFNNLLTAILGYSDILLSKVSSTNSMYADVLEIKQASQRAATLTRQLLAFSRKQILQPRVLDLNAVVSEMEKMLTRLIGEDVELQIALSPTLWRVKADPGQIEQVIMNLAVNARDAMPEGGKLVIETANVELDEDNMRDHHFIQSGAYVMLVVNDTGHGIDEEHIEHIFEPFFTTKGKDKGTGLGLSTVYGIVKQSGGHIRVMSEVGRGTRFMIYLPRVDQEPEVTETHVVASKIARGKETILLVEDEEIVRRLTSEILKSTGYTVIEATCGEEALRQCETYDSHIHLMVTDMVMPGMSGRVLSEKLKLLRPEMKIIYMSGYTDSAMVQQSMQGRGKAFMQKPFTPDDLLRQVRRLLEET